MKIIDHAIIQGSLSLTDYLYMKLGVNDGIKIYGITPNVSSNTSGLSVFHVGDDLDEYTTGGQALTFRFGNFTSTSITSDIGSSAGNFFDAMAMKTTATGTITTVYNAFNLNYITSAGFLKSDASGNVTVDTNTYALASAVAGFVSGSGSINKLPKWSATQTLTDSNIGDSGTVVTIGVDTNGTTFYGTNFRVSGLTSDVVNGATTLGIGYSNIAASSGYMVQLSGAYGLMLVTGGVTRINIPYNGGVTVSTLLSATAGLTVTGGKTTVAASAAGYASLNIPNGVAVTSPTTGDIYATTDEIRYNNGSLLGIDPYVVVNAVSTANIATLSGTTTIDGVALVAGNLVLLQNQTTQSQNGVYVVSASTWSRATSFSNETQLLLRDIYVSGGTANKGTWWMCGNKGNITVGTTPIVITRIPDGISYGAGYAISSTSLSASAPLTYNNTNGVFAITQATTSTNGYLSSTDWNTFNNKQSALTNPITASATGTANFIPKFTAGTTIANSSMLDSNSGRLEFSSTWATADTTTKGIVLREGYQITLGHNTAETYVFLDQVRSDNSQRTNIITITNSAGFIPTLNIASAMTGTSGVFSSTLTSTKFITSGGTSTQFVMGDGSLNSAVYLTTTVAASTYQPLHANLTSLSTNKNDFVGTTNYFGFSRGIAYSNLGTGATTVTIDQSIDGFTILSNGTVAGSARLQNLGFNSIGGNFVISAFIKSSVASSVQLNLCDVNSEEYGTGSISTTTSYQEFIFTFKNVSSYVGTPYFGFLDFELIPTGVTIYVSNLKIERGIIPTDHSSAKNEIYVIEHSTNNINYPVVWDNTSRQLLHTASKMYFNPSTGMFSSTKIAAIGGTSTQFLKADGSLDGTTYVSNTTFNSLINGTTNTIAMFTGSNQIGNSIITQSGTTVTIAGTAKAGSLLIGTDAGISLHGDGKNLYINLTSQSNTSTGLIAPTKTTANNPIIGRADYRWYGVYAGIGDFSTSLTTAGNLTVSGQLVTSTSIINWNNAIENSYTTADGVNSRIVQIGFYSLNSTAYNQHRQNIIISSRNGNCTVYLSFDTYGTQGNYGNSCITVGTGQSIIIKRNVTATVTTWTVYHITTVYDNTVKYKFGTVTSLGSTYNNTVSDTAYTALTTDVTIGYYSYDSYIPGSLNASTIYEGGTLLSTKYIVKPSGGSTSNFLRGDNTWSNYMTAIFYSAGTNAGLQAYNGGGYTEWAVRQLAAGDDSLVISSFASGSYTRDYFRIDRRNEAITLNSNVGITETYAYYIPNIDNNAMSGTSTAYKKLATFTVGSGYGCISGKFNVYERYGSGGIYGHGEYAYTVNKTDGNGSINLYCITNTGTMSKNSVYVIVTAGSTQNATVYEIWYAKASAGQTLITYQFHDTSPRGITLTIAPQVGFTTTAPTGTVAYSSYASSFLPMSATFGGSDGYDFTIESGSNTGGIRLNLWDDADGSEYFRITNNSSELFKFASNGNFSVAGTATVNGHVNASWNTYSSTAATLKVGDAQYGLSSSGGVTYLWAVSGFTFNAATVTLGTIRSTSTIIANNNFDCNKAYSSEGAGAAAYYQWTDSGNTQGSWIHQQGSGNLHIAYIPSGGSSWTTIYTLDKIGNISSGTGTPNYVVANLSYDSLSNIFRSNYIESAPNSGQVRILSQIEIPNDPNDWYKSSSCRQTVFNTYSYKNTDSFFVSDCATIGGILNLEGSTPGSGTSSNSSKYMPKLQLFGNDAIWTSVSNDTSCSSSSSSNYSIYFGSSRSGANAVFNGYYTYLNGTYDTKLYSVNGILFVGSAVASNTSPIYIGGNVSGSSASVNTTGQNTYFYSNNLNMHSPGAINIGNGSSTSSVNISASNINIGLINQVQTPNLILMNNVMSSTNVGFSRVVNTLVNISYTGRFYLPSGPADGQMIEFFLCNVSTGGQVIIRSADVGYGLYLTGGAWVTKNLGTDDLVLAAGNYGGYFRCVYSSSHLKWFIVRV